MNDIAQIMALTVASFIFEINTLHPVSLEYDVKLNQKGKFDGLSNSGKNNDQTHPCQTSEFK